MLCQNCGKNEVNFRYTQIVNGVKKEMALCDKCARELGLEGVDFSMPINFSSFFSDFFNDATSLLPSFAKSNLLECDNCKMSFDDFVDSGEFGCGDCYINFADRISPVLKKIHGASKHIGRQYSQAIDELEDNKSRFEASQKQKEKTESKLSKEEKEKIEAENKIVKLKKDLQKAIKEERYEDAAKLRDEIKKLDK